jgi:hypothetical protein
MCSVINFMNSRIVLFLAISFAAHSLYAQTPSTDIYITNFNLALIDSLGTPISGVKNITSRKGYDNQPYFSQDGNMIFYSSMTKDSTMDIYKYDLKKNKSVQFSNTPKGSEFSPRPDFGGGVLTVRIEEDRVTQRIWKFNEAGKSSLPVIPWVDSVGYYYQVSSNLFLIFILGPNEVNTLRLVDISQKKELMVLDDSVGRCFTGRLIIPDESDLNAPVRLEIHYTVLGKERNEIRKMTLTKANVSKPFEKKDQVVLGSSRGKSQDFIIVDQLMLMAEGSEIFMTKLDKNVFDWQPCGFEKYGLKNITRLAYHAGTGKIALVAQDK